MDTSKNDKRTTMERKQNTTILAAQNSLFDLYLQDCQHQQSTPASSSTSQTTGDTTFEPSIDMMVNDFDDEQTLTEEEALAKLEAQDPSEVIIIEDSEDEVEILKTEQTDTDVGEDGNVGVQENEPKTNVFEENDEEEEEAEFYDCSYKDRLPEHTKSCLNQGPPSKKQHHHNFSIMNETNRSS